MDGWKPKQSEIVAVTGKIHREVFRIPKRDPRWANVNYRNYHGCPEEKHLVVPWKKDLKEGELYATWTKYSFYDWQMPMTVIVLGWSYKLIGEIFQSTGGEFDYEQGHLQEWARFKSWTVMEIDKYDRYHPPFVTIPEYMGKKNNT